MAGSALGAATLYRSIDGPMRGSAAKVAGRTSRDGDGGRETSGRDTKTRAIDPVQMLGVRQDALPEILISRREPQRRHRPI